jgi:hypothetical protein
LVVATVKLVLRHAWRRITAHDAAIAKESRVNIPLAENFHNQVTNALAEEFAEQASTLANGCVRWVCHASREANGKTDLLGVHDLKCWCRDECVSSNIQMTMIDLNSADLI